jgi:uncharacterized protein (DUF1697 family)
MNVGGHRRFRPSLVAEALKAYDVINIGATGTFVVRNPRSRSKFRSALESKLPFRAELSICDGSDLVRLQTANPFGHVSPRNDIVRFVSIFSTARRAPPTLPIVIPANGEWFVRVIAAEKQFVFGEYRRHMKTIRYLTHLDQLFGAPATTRNWNTIAAIVKVLTDHGPD